MWPHWFSAEVNNSWTTIQMKDPVPCWREESSKWKNEVTWGTNDEGQDVHSAGQTIATSHGLTPKGSVLEGKSRYFREIEVDEILFHLARFWAPEKWIFVTGRFFSISFWMVAPVFFKGRYWEKKTVGVESWSSWYTPLNMTNLYWQYSPVCDQYVRSTPHPVTVTTRIITFLVGNPYKPSFATVTGWGVDPTNMGIRGGY